MDPTDLRASLRGVIAFPITPFERNAELSIDSGAFCEHIEFLTSSGVAALVIAGGTGEFFSLSSEEIVRLAELALEVGQQRVPIIAGVGHSVAEGRRVARALEERGIDGLLLMPPYYASPDLDSLPNYYTLIAAAVPKVGCIFYARDHVRLDTDTLDVLAEVPNIIAVKDGQGMIRDFLHARVAHGDRFGWLAGAGDDLVGAYAAAHADGYTSSLACFDPMLSLELWRLASGAQHGNLGRLLATHVVPWFELRRLRRGYEVAVVKAGVEAFGGSAGLVRPPLANLCDDHLKRVLTLAASVGTLAGSRSGTTR